MKILPFRAVYPILEKVPHTNDFFDAVKLQYHNYAAEGLFQPTEKEAIYIYRITNTEGRKFTGLVTGVDIAEYQHGNMKKHEKTIAANELLQSDLLHQRGAAIKPILLTHPSVPELHNLLFEYIEKHKKFYIIHFGGEKHCFWQVSEPEMIQQIQAVFQEKIAYAYIADGHHRSASFAKLHNKIQSDKTAKMLCAFFPEEELSIHSYNRIVKDLNGLTSDAFLDKLTPLFKIKVLKKGAKPYAKFEMAMYVEDSWFQLNWRKSELKEFAANGVLLDVHLLNEKILKPILGIKNISENTRIKYIEGTKSLKEIENACPTEGVAFCLYPVYFEDMKEVADANIMLPPKSTFFEPRMKNGLLIYEI